MDRQTLVASRSLLAWLFVGLLASAPASALDPSRSLVQMYHRAYTRDDGLSGAVHGIAQTPDGYLWVGTDDGLYRFDGMRFDRVADNRMFSRGILGLGTSASGDLWVGYADGGLSRLRSGAVTNYTTTAEGAELIAQGFQESPKRGGLWAVGGYGPYRFDGRNWHAMSGPWVPASQGGGLRGSEAARDGTFWGKNADKVFYCRPGCGRFVAAQGYAGGVMGFTRDREGRVWTSDTRAPGHMYAMPNISGVSDAAIPAPLYGGQISPRVQIRIFLDRDGTLWSINQQHGLLRVRSILAGRSDPGQLDAFGTSDGLSSDVVTKFYEDREGSIWVGTNNGLDRFRPANVVLERQIPEKVTLNGYNAARVVHALYVCASTSEDISSPQDPARGPLYRVNADSSVQLVLPEMELPFTMAPAADGGLWAGLSKGLYKLQNDSLFAESLPPSLQGKRVIAIAESGTGVLWLSTLGRGLWRRANGAWSHIPGRPDQESPQWGNMAFDSQGILWLVDGRTIAHYMNGRLLEIPAAAGPNVGAIQTMYADKHGILFGGEFGLARFDGRHFQTLRSERVPALALVSGIAAYDSQTWIASQAGVLRFDTNALDRALTQPDAPLPQFELFDRQDGLSGSMQQGVYSGSASSAFLGPDGRIWFLTNRGIVWIDPHHIYRNALPPPVAIRSLIVDGRTYASPGDLNLRAGASNLEIDYAALSFTEPSRVQFRYKLDGVDSDWIDPGQRRQAFYTRLGPGNYTFHVIASNNDGVWNRTGASLAFTIPPTFVQSNMFIALCTLAGIALLWLLYMLRLRQVSARFGVLLHERLDERERIARELHDTLLQGFHGIMLHFRSVGEEIPPDLPARAKLSAALDEAEAVLVEGRDRVRNLRSATMHGDLPESLAAAGNRLALDSPTKFRVTAEGSVRALHPVARDEICKIGEEAVFNAFQHARAKNIEVNIAYGRDHLSLHVRDDGVGIDSVALAEGKEGHFGLTGMRERAQKIRAEIQIESRPGGGTDVQLAIPANIAYAGRTTSRLNALFGRTALDKA